VKRLGEGDGDYQPEGQQGVQPPDELLRQPDRADRQRRHDFRQSVAHRGPNGRGKDGAALGNACQLGILPRAAHVGEPLAQANFFYHAGLRLRTLGSGHLGLDIEPLCNPEPPDYKPGDCDQKQGGEKGE